MKKKARVWYWTAERLSVLVECLKKLGIEQKDGTFVIPTTQGGLARSVAPLYWEHDDAVQMTFVQKGLSVLIAIGVLDMATLGDQRNKSRHLNPTVPITDEAVNTHRASL